MTKRIKMNITKGVVIAILFTMLLIKTIVSGSSLSNTDGNRLPLLFPQTSGN